MTRGRPLESATQNGYYPLVAGKVPDGSAPPNRRVDKARGCVVMEKLVRLSMSIEKSLFQKLERMVERRGYENRSEFIRDTVREMIVDEQWKKNEVVIGTVMLVYDHNRRELSEKLTDLQHHQHDMILASTHVHLDQNLCAEMIMVRGKAGDITRLADSLRQQRGVLHAKLITSSTGKEL